MKWIGGLREKIGCAIIPARHWHEWSWRLKIIDFCLDMAFFSHEFLIDINDFLGELKHILLKSMIGSRRVRIWLPACHLALAQQYVVDVRIHLL